MQDDLAVNGGLEDGTFGFQFVAQEVGIDQIAVMPDGDLAAHAIGHDRLRIFQRARAGRRITDVPDGAGARQLGRFPRR